MNRTGRALSALGRGIVHTGHAVGRRLHWTSGARLTRVGLRVHLTGHHLATREREGGGTVASNGHLALILMGAAVLIGFGQHLGGPVLGIVPPVIEGVMSGVGASLTVASLVLAVASYRERPFRAGRHHHQ